MSTVLEKDNNKRIAKNTIFLYIRMLLVMAVSLYTSRVVLQVLGVSDYGVYNVMGGIIGMLGYVNTLLSGATSRFLTIDLGKGNLNNLKLTFSISNLLCVASSIIFLILGETVGLWFMNTQLNIDPLRIDAANWVYQCALLSSVFTVLQSPFSASIIAHEKMNIYAYMSIFDVIMKLSIVYVLIVFDIDKLKLYSLLLFTVNIINYIIYSSYARRKFEEASLRLAYNKEKIKEMFSYSGWNMIILFANMLNNYGLNILLNMFFGTIVNAARGLALQVNQVASQLYSNFQTASRPQIMKYYAQGNLNGMSNLICNTSKYSGLLLLCLIIPVFCNIDGLLKIWLGQIPEYTSWFVRVILLQTLFSAIDYPVGMGIQAVGKMKLPNLTVSIIYLLVFPLTYIFLKLGAGPITSYVIYIASAPFILLVDLLIFRKYTGFDILLFVRNTLFPLLKVIIISIFIVLPISILGDDTCILIVLCKTVAMALCVCLSAFTFGLPKGIKSSIMNKLFSLVKN